MKTFLALLEFGFYFCFIDGYSCGKVIVTYLNVFYRYFDEDDEPPTPALAYIPAPGSPTYEAASSSKVLNQLVIL